MGQIARLVGLQRGRERFGARAERMAAFFSESDPLADAAILAMGALPRAAQEAMVSRAIAQGVTRVPDAPDALVALFTQLQHVPFWVDPARCDRGGHVFFRCGPFGGIALGFGSLARAYCSAGGNKPLIFTRALLEDTPRRVANTGKFVCAVSGPGGLRVHGPGYAAVVRVRLMHARVRQSLLLDARFRQADWGLPINQADMAMTTLLFSHGFAVFVRALGIPVSAEEEADLIHLWRYAGYLLGVREELLCASVDEAQAMTALVELIDDGPDEDSRRLLRPMLSREPFELVIQTRPLAHALHRQYVAACRTLIGDAFADRVGLPRGRGDRIYRGLVRPTIAGLGRTLPHAPGAAQLSNQIGRRYWAAMTQAAPPSGAT